MGNCYKSKKPGSIISYNRNPVIYIKYGQDKLIPSDRIKFKITDPVKEICESQEIGNFKFRITSCVIPGQDPRGEIQKVCQDNIATSYKAGFMLLSLFDGHGAKGDEVVVHARDHMTAYFLAQNFQENAPDDYTEFFKGMYLSCEESLLNRQNKINCYGSGTTAVSILITPKGIYAASVGDSRAVLATLPQEKYIPESPRNSLNKKEFIPFRVLEPIQMTVDQKPNLDQELSRIVQAGGVVAKAKDPAGNALGPYRVFQKGKQIPGLAMSRSLGDVAGKKVGVIAEPIINFYSLVQFKDQFLIIASDGVWDVMTNIEVLNFVDKFKEKCIKTPLKDDKNPINASNSTIARLLCEEARFRWYGVCSEEDVVIDDISVIVAEINTNELDSETEGVDDRISQDFGSYLEVHSEFNTPSLHSVRDTLVDPSLIDQDMKDLELPN